MSARRKYSKELVAYIRSIYENSYDITGDRAIELVKENMGVEITYKQLIDIKAHHRIKRKPKPVSEMVEFVTEYIKTHTRDETQDAVVEKFGINKDFSVHQFMSLHRIRSGRDGRFKPGQTPCNKGKKMSPDVYEKVKHNFFPKKNRPHNACDVGAIVVDTEGYLRIKLAEPDRWTGLHTYIWTLKNGPVPEGHVLTFLDGNKNNCVLDNLMLVRKKTNLRLNQRGLNFKSADMQKAAILAVEIENKVKDKNK